jgi:RNA ligase
MESPKYNRTFHFPFSPGATSDDKIADSMESLIGVEILLTEKMDGSNTSLELGGCFARTHSGPPNHPSFDGLKALHAQIGFQMPSGMQFFGEWCFAKHSIAYEELPGYFLLFGIRELDDKNPFWYSWDDIEFHANYFGLSTVPVLFKGVVKSESELKDLVESLMIQPSCCGGIREGVVCRVTREFDDKEFPKCVMKCVRANHVQTSDHWKDQEIIRNKLK